MYAQNEKYRWALGLGYHIPDFRVMMLFLILVNRSMLVLNEAFLLYSVLSARHFLRALGASPFVLRSGTSCKRSASILHVLFLCSAGVYCGLYTPLFLHRARDKKTSSKKLTAYLRADPQRATLKN